jgi:hypothetical protein
MGRRSRLGPAIGLVMLGAGCAVEVDRARGGGTRATAAGVSIPLPALAAAPVPKAEPAVRGALVEVKGLTVLRLAGTPREMGYAHGRALAERIREGFEEFVLGYRCHGIRARYEQIARRVENEVDFPERVLEELEGMLEGIQASGTDLTLPMLRRELRLVDLKVLNSVDHWGLFGCSGFTAWGRCTADGEVICARNFDFDVDPNQQAVVRLGVVLVFEPEDALRFVSFSFPGMVGAVSGISEAGVGVFLHVGNGAFGGGEEGRSLPPAVLARLVLEECSPATAAPRARELLASARFRNSYLVRIVTPGKDAPPTTVFEADPSGFQEQRLPDEESGEPPLLVTTNHYLTRGAQFSAIHDSKIRFCNLEDSARKCLADGDRVIAPEEAWEGLKIVRQDRGIVTLHSIVWKPATHELWAAFGGIDSERGRAIAAPRRPPARVALGELLGE